MVELFSRHRTDLIRHTLCPLSLVYHLDALFMFEKYIETFLHHFEVTQLQYF